MIISPRWRQLVAAYRATTERGAALTLLAVVMVPALLLCVGLVIDGGGKVAAAREAQTAASEAARAAEDAAASKDLGGQAGAPAAYRAAQSYLDAAGVRGTVKIAGGQVVVHTTATYDPVFLVGVGPLVAHGDSAATIATVAP